MFGHQQWIGCGLALWFAVAGGIPIHHGMSQTSLSSAVEMTPEIREKLSQRVSLDLRDATLLDALFAVRDISGLNMVVGNEVAGTVNASFVDSTVYEILDSLLITRGYGYRIVGGSLAIVPLDSLGNQLPLFETTVIHMEHSKVEELVETVESMLSPEGTVHGVGSSNSLVVMDYPGRLEKVRQQVEALEKAAASHKTQLAQAIAGSALSVTGSAHSGSVPVVRVFQLQYVPADVMVEALTPLLSETGQMAPVVSEDKLIVTDTPDTIKRIESAIQQLDLPRPQVRIWALIYDCSTEDLQRLGVNWRSGFNGSAMDAVSGNPQQQVVLDTVTATVAGAPNGTLSLTSLNSLADVTAIVQALNTADDSRLLADPNVVVMNHEAAEIAIVTEVPYQQLTQGIEGGTIGTTEFREAGVTLKVTPHIAQDATISLIVNPKFSLLTGFSQPDNAPIIDRRETSTTVRVANNQTLVLGGLRQRTRITDRSSIPFFGKIPYVGKLFRHRNNTARESELLVFITPQIVMPTYHGRPREMCTAENLKREIDCTPTYPIPYGMEAIRAEDRARIHRLNHPYENRQSQCDTTERIPFEHVFAEPSSSSDSVLVPESVNTLELSYPQTP